jgi:hypothetical protein
MPPHTCKWGVFLGGENLLIPPQKIFEGWFWKSKFNIHPHFPKISKFIDKYNQQNAIFVGI